MLCARLHLTGSDSFLRMLTGCICAGQAIQSLTVAIAVLVVHEAQNQLPDQQAACAVLLHFMKLVEAALCTVGYPPESTWYHWMADQMVAFGGPTEDGHYELYPAIADILIALLRTLTMSAEQVPHLAGDDYDEPLAAEVAYFIQGE